MNAKEYLNQAYRMEQRVKSKLDQIEALKCHASQFPADSQAFRSLRLYLTLRAVQFGIRTFRGRAEGFRVLGKTQMHCLPEAR